MPKKKTQALNPWTSEDVRELKAHSKVRTPVAKAAKACCAIAKRDTVSSGFSIAR